jgi:hypothetical protein
MRSLFLEQIYLGEVYGAGRGHSKTEGEAEAEEGAYRFLVTILGGVEKWMAERGCRSIEQFRGSLDLDNRPDAAALERGHYQRLLQGWRL